MPAQIATTKRISLSIVLSPVCCVSIITDVREGVKTTIATRLTSGHNTTENNCYGGGYLKKRSTLKECNSLLDGYCESQHRYAVYVTLSSPSLLFSI